MSIMDTEEPLNLCLKDEQRFATDSGNEDRLSATDNCTASDNEEDDDDEGRGGSGGALGIDAMAGGPEIHSALSVIEQINSLRKFIHEKRLSKFYEMYLMQLRVPVVLS